LLQPIRSGIGTDDAAPGADHARAERWHWHVIWPAVGAQDRTVVAQRARHVDRLHAIGAHEGDWRPGPLSGRQRNRISLSPPYSWRAALKRAKLLCPFDRETRLAVSFNVLSVRQDYDDEL
jgi:hypothetical protein